MLVAEAKWRVLVNLAAFFLRSLLEREIDRLRKRIGLGALIHEIIVGGNLLWWLLRKRVLGIELWLETLIFLLKLVYLILELFFFLIHCNHFLIEIEHRDLIDLQLVPVSCFPFLLRMGVRARGLKAEHVVTVVIKFLIRASRFFCYGERLELKIGILH